jgi:hypothetical protein
MVQFLVFVLPPLNRTEPDHGSTKVSEEGQLLPLSFVPTGSNGPSISSKKVGGHFRMGKAIVDLRNMKTAKVVYSNLVSPILM